MFRILDNLVSNAIKFTPAGGDVKVSVSQADGFVRLEVAGLRASGSPPTIRSGCSNASTRTSTAVEQHFPGTGLGLYIARAIVEAHGGSIAVRSGPGEGASFSVALPAGLAAPLV